MAYYRAYRIHITAVASVAASDLASIIEIEMHGTYGGSDLCTGGTAIESGHYGSFPVANAFDNDSGTFWASENVLPGTSVWAGYDFGTATTVVEYSIAFRADGYDNQAPMEWTFEGSDDLSNWTVIETRSNYGKYSWKRGAAKVFSLGAPWYQLVISECNNAVHIGWTEIEMMETVGGSNLCTAYNYDAPNGNYADVYNYGAVYAFDGSNATECIYPWATGLKIGYSFNSDVEILQYSIRVRDTYYTQSPKAWILRRTYNGVDWETVDTRTDITDWTNNERRTFNITGGGETVAFPAPVNITGVWKDGAGVAVNIGGVWKTIAGAWVNIGGVWKTLA